MTKPFVGHDPQTFFHAFVWVGDGQVCRHNFGDFCVGRFLAPQHNFPCVIALGKHTDEFVVLHDEKCADVLFIHHRDRIMHGGLRRNRKNLAAFLAQDRADISTYIHGSTTTSSVSRKLRKIQNKQRAVSMQNNFSGAWPSRRRCWSQQAGRPLAAQVRTLDGFVLWRTGSLCSGYRANFSSINFRR
jgi:hypothetical protein